MVRRLGGSSTRWALGVLLLFAACGTPLPSETPLGMGPLARAERDRRAREAAPEEEPADAGAEASAPRTSAPEPKDAAARETLAASDAGPAKDAAVPAEAGGTLKWAGLYAGKDVTVIRLGSLPEQKQDDPNAKTRVADRNDGGVDLTAVSSSDGSDICTLRADPKGKTRKQFELKKGQKCFEMGSGTSGEVVSGTARFEGNKLVLDMKLEVNARMQGTDVKGSIDYHFEGTR